LIAACLRRTQGGVSRAARAIIASSSHRVFGNQCGSWRLRFLSRDYVGRELIFKECKTVPEEELSFLEPLNLQPVAAAKMGKRLDRSIKIAVLLLQTLEFRLQ
jgi:hypothetical protein